MVDPIAKERGRLLYYSNHLRGPKGSAGARTWHQVNRISDSFDVTVVIPSIDPVTASPVTDVTFEGLNFDHVEVVRIDTSENDRSSLLRRAKYYLSAMWGQIFCGLKQKNIDIVISMGLPVTTLFVAWAMAVRHRAKFVIDVRDLPFETALEVGYIKSRWVIKTARLVEGFFLRRACHILTNSPRYKPLLIDRGVEIERVTVAYIGYDNFGEPPGEEVNGWRDKLLTQLDASTKTIGVYAGTIGHAFPVECILEGANILNDDRSHAFVFIGDGQRLEKFKLFAKKHNLNAVFLGRLPKNSVVRICRAADYCIYPANTGTFSAAILGNKVFDYLGARKPVLYIGADSAVKDLLTEIGAGLYSAPDAPDDFAKNVLQLTSNNALAQSLADKSAAAIVEGSYTAQRSADALLDILTGLFEESTQR